MLSAVLGVTAEGTEGATVIHDSVNVATVELFSRDRSVYRGQKRRLGGMYAYFSPSLIVTIRNQSSRQQLQVILH